MNTQIARQNMVEQQIRPWYVWDERVLSIMSNLPREQFVPQEFARVAYTDNEIPLLHQEKMLSPKLVARALDILKISDHDKVLEVGTGTGYITAILAQLAKKVISVEISPDLAKLAASNLVPYQNPTLTLEIGDGVLGWPTKAPYDVIFVTAAYPMGVPEKLCQQLTEGGRLFAICGESGAQHAILIQRLNNQFKTISLFETKAPFLKNAECSPKFKF